MRTHHIPNRRRPTCLALVLLVVLAPTFARAQEPKSEVVSANGEGTIKIGREEFKVYSVIAKLFEDGAAELNLTSDITIFINARWSIKGDTKSGIELQIIGAANRGGITGSGKLFLSSDRKAITTLKMQAINTVTRRNIDVYFVAKQSGASNRVK